MKSEQPRMSFGKYRGCVIADIPTDYLQWLSGRSDLWPDLRIAVTNELNERYEFEHARAEAYAAKQAAAAPLFAIEDVELLAVFLDEGYYRLAQRCHPDAGGTHDVMVLLNQDRERLHALVEQLRKAAR